ncbi:hypothetical protein H8356DRAFT_1361883 [Neocallimastix lanati (nom. inval.)]|nr:hypothetical protein H8356DRAFT_1361883 [Neocallimastix sp. JGI-2020a]
MGTAWEYRDKVVTTPYAFSPRPIIIDLSLTCTSPESYKVFFSFQAFLGASTPENSIRQASSRGNMEVEVVKSMIKILFLYNAFNCGNLTIDNVNSNNDNSNSNNSNSNSNNINSIINNISNSIENNVYIDSSVCEKVFIFLFEGRSINNKLILILSILGGYCGSSSIDYTLFAIGQQWSLFNRFKSNPITTTKSVNAEETVKTGQQD